MQGRNFAATDEYNYLHMNETESESSFPLSPSFYINGTVQPASLTFAPPFAPVWDSTIAQGGKGGLCCKIDFDPVNCLKNKVHCTDFQLGKVYYHSAHSI